MLEIKEGSKLKQLSWVSYVEYDVSNGKIEIAFDPRLKPYLLQLKREFTSYKLKHVLELKSSYSIRIYEILKKWQTIGKIEIQLEDLRKMLGVTDKYLEYHNFKKRVLNKAKTEINEKTDLSFDFEEVKTGRMVTGIKFFINTILKLPDSSETVAPNTDSWFESLYNQLDPLFRNIGIIIKKDLLLKWLELAENIWGTNNSKYVNLLNLIQDALKQDNIENYIGFITYLLKEKAKNGSNHEAITINRIKKVIRTEPLPTWWNEYISGFYMSSKTDESEDIIEWDIDIDKPLTYGEYKKLHENKN